MVKIALSHKIHRKTLDLLEASGLTLANQAEQTDFSRRVYDELNLSGKIRKNAPSRMRRFLNENLRANKKPRWLRRNHVYGPKFERIAPLPALPLKENNKDAAVAVVEDEENVEDLVEGDEEEEDVESSGESEEEEDDAPQSEITDEMAMEMEEQPGQEEGRPIPPTNEAVPALEEEVHEDVVVAVQPNNSQNEPVRAKQTRKKRRHESSPPPFDVEDVKAGAPPAANTRHQHRVLAEIFYVGQPQPVQEEEISRPYRSAVRRKTPFNEPAQGEGVEDGGDVDAQEELNARTPAKRGRASGRRCESTAPVENRDEDPLPEVIPPAPVTQRTQRRTTATAEEGDAPDAQAVGHGDAHGLEEDVPPRNERSEQRLVVDDLPEEEMATPPRRTLSEAPEKQEEPEENEERPPRRMQVSRALLNELRSTRENLPVFMGYMAGQAAAEARAAAARAAQDARNVRGASRARTPKKSAPKNRG